MNSFVYWIYDDSCSDVLIEGYVGVTKDVENRVKAHLRKNRVPSDSTYKILFEGTREECFNYERQLRPTKNIGWNNAIGGSHGWRTGFSHSEETKSKLKSKWTEDRKATASIFKIEQNKKLIGQKRPKQSKAMSGDKNPMFGTTRPDHVKEAVRNAHLGKEPANKQNNHCPHCGKRVSFSIMKKYHGPGKKECV